MTRSLSCALVIAFGLSAAPALAQSLSQTKAPPTCDSLLARCVRHVNKVASQYAGADPAKRPHMTLDECYDNGLQAEKTGVWPAHLPLNFAITCTP